MVIAGIGIGSMMQVFVISVQNAVPRSKIGSATALTQFGRQMGATLGVTIMGVIVNHGLPSGVAHGRAHERPSVCPSGRASVSQMRSGRRSSPQHASPRSSG